MQKIKHGVDNIFDYLPEHITTVNVVLDSVKFGLKEFAEKTESIVKKLNIKHSKNDDFFDIHANKVLKIDTLCNTYNLKIIP